MAMYSGPKRVAVIESVAVKRGYTVIVMSTVHCISQRDEQQTSGHVIV